MLEKPQQRVNPVERRDTLKETLLRDFPFFIESLQALFSLPSNAFISQLGNR